MNKILNAVKSVINSGKDNFTVGDIHKKCQDVSLSDIRIWLQKNGAGYGIIHATIDVNPENNSYNFIGMPHSDAGEFSYRTTEVKELALQRALISSKSTHGIKWIDIELHIDPWLKNESKRIDIIGYSDKEKKYYVGEIKFYPSNDNLKTTIVQLNDYWEIIKENALVLEKSNFHHKNALGRFSWTDLNDDNTNLIVISESSFFESDDEKLGSTEPVIIKHSSGVSLLNLGEMNEDFFQKQQKESRREYQPRLSIRHILWREEFLRKH